MGKGGSTTTKTVSDPWKPAQPYVLQGLQNAQSVIQNPAQYYPGQTFLGPTPGQLQGWSDQLGYMDSVFGGQPTLKYGDAVSGLGSLMSGGQMGNLAGALAPQALSQIGAWNPFGTAGNLNATGAINQALSGQPDYTGLQSMVDAANAPILRDFQNNVLPSLNSRATFLNNDTGGVKALQTILPDIAQRMDENAQGIYNQARQQALQNQMGMAQFVASGGQGANQGALSLGNLVGTLSGGAQGNLAQGLGLFGTLGQMGQLPANTNQAFADWGANFQNQALQSDINRWNFLQQQPQDLATWYSQMVNGTAGLGGTGSQQTPNGAGNGALGVLGGALGGASLGSMIPALGTGWGAGLGALAAMI